MDKKKERMYVWIEGWIGPNVIIDNIYNDMTDKGKYLILNLTIMIADATCTIYILFLCMRTTRGDSIIEGKTTMMWERSRY